MTQTYWPFDGVTVNETQYSQLFRRLQHSGVWGDQNDTALKPFADLSGMNVKVPAGYALVRGHMYYNDATVTLTVTAASASNPRMDAVVLRLDPTANTITPLVIAGTPGASPQPASPVQTDAGNYDILLGYVLVPTSSSSVNPANVTDMRLFMGSQVGKWRSGTRPGTTGTGAPAVRVGDMGWNSTIGAPEYYDAVNGWTSLVPANFASSKIIIGNKIDPVTNTATLTSTLDEVLVNSRGFAGPGFGGSQDTNKTTIQTAPLDSARYAAIDIEQASYRFRSSSSTPWQYAIGVGRPQATIWSEEDLYLTSGDRGDLGNSPAIVLSRNTSKTVFSPWIYDATSSAAANLVISSSSSIKRSTSSRRYKTDIKLDDRSANVLKIELASWYDKGEVRENDGSTEGLVRYHGAIAEQLDEIGMGHRVTYNEEGQPEAIQYDRIALDLIPVVKNLLERIEALEAKIA